MLLLEPPAPEPPVPEPVEAALDEAALVEAALVEAALDEAALVEAALDEAALDEAALEEAALDEAALEVVPPGMKQEPIDGEVLGASHEGFVLSVALMHTPTPSWPPAAVSHLPVPQSVSVQQ